MGFFSELFSKQTCAFCGNQVGAMSRKKMQDKNFICKECQSSHALVNAHGYGWSGTH